MALEQHLVIIYTRPLKGKHISFWVTLGKAVPNLNLLPTFECFNEIYCVVNFKMLTKNKDLGNFREFYKIVKPS